MKRVAVAAFSERGCALAERVRAVLEQADMQARVTPVRGREPTLEAWTREAFGWADALVFIGAAGIAVRAVAPYLRHKLEDPAVLAADECGRFCIPLVGGHAGGANRLARLLAGRLEMTAVVTTATDLAGVFAADEWAVRQGCRIANPARIKRVAGMLLEGIPVGWCGELPAAGPLPAGLVPCGANDCDLLLSVCTDGAPDALRLVPPVGVLGIGCRRGTQAEQIARAVDAFLSDLRVHPLAVGLVCSVDRKADEPGLLRCCAERGWPTRFFSSEELAAVPGSFSDSVFVRRTVGVGCVCERAVAAAGARLEQGKTIVDGIACAWGLLPYTAHFERETEEYA